ncbi:MAG: hypothetical protein K0Q90_3148 [Paenibacillaceae bacterium]|nr:hypothetical protein [Paenibacillaceae bacterium]
MKSIAKQLRMSRKEKGLPLEKLAWEVNIHVETLLRYERGGIPSVPDVLKLQRYFAGRSCTHIQPNWLHRI